MFPDAGRGFSCLPTMDVGAAHTLPLQNLKHRTFSFMENVKYIDTLTKVTLFYASKMREITYQLKNVHSVFYFNDTSDLQK